MTSVNGPGRKCKSRSMWWTPSCSRCLTYELGQSRLRNIFERVISPLIRPYKLPVGFHKSLELFNLHRAIGDSNPDTRVVLVEGFFDCIKVAMAGFACVALMGSSLSEEQEKLLGQHFDKVCLFMDGDGAGKEAGEVIAQRLTRRLYVRVVDLPEGKQPDQLDLEILRQLLSK